MEQLAEREGSSFLNARGRSIKFTPERIQQITNLVERGKRREEIADILDVTVGSLQVTCSRMGISLRRPKTINWVGLLPKRKPFYDPSDHDGRVPSQPTEEQSSRNSAPDARSISFAIRFQYSGRERTVELPFPPHMIEQLMMEAAVRGVSLGDLIAELITAVVSKDLVPQALDNTDPATDRSEGRGT